MGSSRLPEFVLPRLHRQCLRFVAGVLGVLMSVSLAFAQHTEGGVVQGTVVNSAGAVVGDASVMLEQEGVPGARETKTSAAGVFAFSALRAGNYQLSAHKAGLGTRSATVQVGSSRDGNHVDLVLDEGQPSIQSSTQAMEFADKPNFTVAGVTDWTAVGGHGSDATLRTSEALARETLTLKPDNPAKHGNEYDLALAYKESGDYTVAREHVQKLLAQQDTADLHRLLGELDEKTGDPLAAVHEDEQAVRLDPSEQNYFAWGSELLLHRAVWQAAEVFRQGTKAHPHSARMLTALGAALFAAALYDQAATSLCAASDLNPSDPEPYSFMGRIAIASPKPLACIEPRLARFVQAHPENSLGNYFYAMAIWKRQQQPVDPKAAHQVETLLTKAVAIDPKCGDAYLQLGILYFSQHQPEKAIGFYTKAIQSDPQLGEAHYRLGVAYDRMGSPERAAQEFKLHDEIEKEQSATVERQRREVKQFQVVLEGQPGYPPPPK
jgi:tetratricopeptide (TPR) repeat protein